MTSRAESLVKFLNLSRTPFHAVAQCKEMLNASGFKELAERDEWKLTRGGRYYYTVPLLLPPDLIPFSATSPQLWPLQ